MKKQNMSYRVKEVVKNPNLIYYALKRYGWSLDLRRYFCEFSDIDVESPVFFLGTHGSGLTLISRMLRRNERVISVSGNHEYWSGADEMAVVMGSILPFELGGVKHNIPLNSHFNTTTAWVYASNELIDEYRLTSEDATDELRNTLLHIIRWIIHRHAEKREGSRFTDKSQVYTVRASLINKLLEGKNPRFILVTRNPYVLAHRAPEKAAALRQLPSTFTRKDKIKIASQHWKKSMISALNDSKEIDHFTTIKFEELIRQPKNKIKHLCKVVDIEYDPVMIPRKGDHVPFGSRYRDRWYPLRKNVNEKHFRNMSKEEIEVVNDEIGMLGHKLGYSLEEALERSK